MYLFIYMYSCDNNNGLAIIVKFLHFFQIIMGPNFHKKYIQMEEDII